MEDEATAELPVKLIDILVLDGDALPLSGFPVKDGLGILAEVE